MFLNVHVIQGVVNTVVYSFKLAFGQFNKSCTHTSIAVLEDLFIYLKEKTTKTHFATGVFRRWIKKI